MAGSKAGAQKGAASAQAAQAQAAAAPAPAAAPPETAAPPVEPSTDEKMDQLAKLKQLLDMDAITKDEYDAQKTRILASM
jgi:hypothetical protein